MTCPNAPLSRRDVNVYIGERVHGLLWKTRHTQTEFGHVLGVDQASISNRLRGKTAWTAWEVLVTAEWLGVPISTLLPEGPTRWSAP